MRKRLRKKLHLKEFAEYGIFMTLKSTPETCQEILRKAQDVAVRHGLSCWGGGEGHFLLPHAADDYELPTLVELVVRCCALELKSGTMMFCITSIDRHPIPDSVSDELKEAFSIPDYELIVKPHVSLWPRNRD